MRLGILSDAHGNVEAFQLALRVLEEHSVDEIYFLGDAVGYIPESGVVALLHCSKIRSIKGNHDDMLLQHNTTVDQDAIYRHRETFAALSVLECQFLMTLPSQLRCNEHGVDILFVHGSPNEPLTGYVYPDNSLGEFSAVNADVVFMGHTHYPFVRHHGDKLFVNVGSCGLPRGSDLRGSVCVFDSLERDARIIRFDISGCCARALSRYSLSPSVASLLKRCAQYGVDHDLER